MLIGNQSCLLGQIDRSQVTFTANAFHCTRCCKAQMNRMIRHNKCLDGAKSDFYKYDWHHEGNEDRYKENETHWEIESLPLHRGISSTKFHAWFLIDRHSIVRIHILFGIILNTSMSSTKAWHGPRHAINSYAFRHETWTNRRQHRTHNTQQDSCSFTQTDLLVIFQFSLMPVNTIQYMKCQQSRYDHSWWCHASRQTHWANKSFVTIISAPRQNLHQSFCHPLQ